MSHIGRVDTPWPPICSLLISWWPLYLVGLVSEISNDIFELALFWSPKAPSKSNILIGGYSTTESKIPK
jgi:hypothetical protein